MDFDRIKFLAGLTEADYTKVTPYETKSTELSAEQKAAAKSNNEDTKNRTVDDVLTDKVDVDVTKPNKPKKFEVTKITPKKFDYKVEIDKNGLTKVSNNTVVETISAQDWIKQPDYHTSFFTVKAGDDFVTEATDCSVTLGESADAVLFNNSEVAQDFADIVDGEVYESVLIDPMVQLAESAIMADYPDLVEGDFTSPANRLDNIEQDITSRLQQHQQVMIALNYQGQMFTGEIASITPAGINVVPTVQTVKRYNIANPKQVLLPVDYKSLKWSDRRDNLVVGHAKDSAANLLKAPEPAQLSNQKPELGNPNDPSTFRVDLSSFEGPNGEKLVESTKPKKLIEYIATNLLNENAALQSKLAGLKKELKAAQADDDQELIDDIRSDIQDVERKIAKCTASMTKCE